MSLPFPHCAIDLARHFPKDGPFDLDFLLRMDADREKIALLTMELKGDDDSRMEELRGLLRGYFPRWRVFARMVENGRESCRTITPFAFGWIFPGGKSYDFPVVRFETICLAILYARVSLVLAERLADEGIRPFRDHFHTAFHLYSNECVHEIHSWTLRDESKLPFECTSSGCATGQLRTMVLMQKRALDVAKKKIDYSTMPVADPFLVACCRLALWGYLASKKLKEMGPDLEEDFRRALYLLSALLLERRGEHASCLRMVQLLEVRRTSILGIISRMRAPDPKDGVEPRGLCARHVATEISRIKLVNAASWLAKADEETPVSEILPVKDGIFYKADAMGDLSSLGFEEADMRAIYARMVL